MRTGYTYKSRIETPKSLFIKTLDWDKLREIYEESKTHYQSLGGRIATYNEVKLFLKSDVCAHTPLDVDNGHVVEKVLSNVQS